MSLGPCLGPLDNILQNLLDLRLRLIIDSDLISSPNNYCYLFRIYDRSCVDLII